MSGWRAVLLGRRAAKEACVHESQTILKVAYVCCSWSAWSGACKVNMQVVSSEASVGRCLVKL